MYCISCEVNGASTIGWLTAMSPGNQTQWWSQPRGTHLLQSYKKNWLQLNAAPMGIGQCGLGSASKGRGGHQPALRQVSLGPWEPPVPVPVRRLSQGSSFWRWGDTAWCKGQNPVLWD